MERELRGALAVGITTLANDLGGKAQRDAPVAEGTLRGTMAVEEANPVDLTARVTFSTPYAARQHEEVGWQHPKGGKAKYLEDHVKELAPRYARILGAIVKRGSRL
jgi:hypothetical protein